MNSFPAPDPIPLPAPVWLMKALHIVTLSLHFIAVEMLIGGLILAVILSLNQKVEARVTARALAQRMTVVMTYVINFGVPPLLFAQVLYGRALYTSSVLIGAYWISVVFLLMLCYWLLYRFQARLAAGQNAWLTGLVAWGIAAMIARILSSNMTLMLRPEAWQGMYRISAGGTELPAGDPTLLWRWLFMMCGGAMMAGLWLIYLSARSTFAAPDSRFMSRLGGLLTALGAVVLSGFGWMVAGALPPEVQAAIAQNTFYRLSGFAFLAVVLLVAVYGLLAFTRVVSGIVVSVATPLLGLVAMATAVLYRDGIRDLTLLTKGFDVWSKDTVTNWGVVVIFLVLFVAALGTIGWLALVVAKSRKESESLATL